MFPMKKWKITHKTTLMFAVTPFLSQMWEVLQSKGPSPTGTACVGYSQELLTAIFRLKN